MNVKICGVCSAADGALVAAAGATHIGVILAARSPRLRTEAEAAAIYAAAESLQRVGVFADAEAGEVIGLARRLALDVVQLHGAEAPGIVMDIRAAGGWQLWKAVRVTEAVALQNALEMWRGRTDALLIDGVSDRGLGGTGVRAPVQALAPARWMGEPRLVLAGGLTPDNVAGAVGVLNPDVVDVSSGVESEPGCKDAALVRAFVREANAAHAARAAARNGG